MIGNLGNHFPIAQIAHEQNARGQGQNARGSVLGNLGILGIPNKIALAHRCSAT